MSNTEREGQSDNAEIEDLDVDPNEAGEVKGGRSLAGDPCDGGE